MKKVLFYLGAILFMSFKGFSQQKPNIIFILTDDHRFNALSYLGNPYAYTPEIDKLAKSGTFFKNAFSTTPICAASRASILTGLHERTHKYTFQTADIRNEYMQNAYPKLLKDNGYKTAFFGKLGVNYENLNQQFDTYEDYDRNNAFKDKRGYFYKKIGKDTVHLTRYTGQKAIDYISSTNKNKPFCLSVSFSAPHAHDGAPDQYFYDQQTALLLENTLIAEPKFASDSYFNSQPLEVQKGFNRTRWGWRFDTPEKYQKMMKAYYRMIAGVDIEVGKIRQELVNKGLDKNTIIVFMGDNGYFLGERQLADKWLMYDLSTRIPLIIYDPRATHKEVSDMVLNIDIPSTIADYAAIKTPASWHGKSLKPYMLNQKPVKRDTILLEHLWEFENIPPSEGIRTNDYKYFRYINNKNLEELYDLKTDTDEIKNLVGDAKYSSVLNTLRKKTDELIIKNADPILQSPFGLTVEFIRKPAFVKIIDSKPEFGWLVPKTVQSQKAYQILVSKSAENLDKNIGEVWNSGQIRSNASSEVSFGAKTGLSPGKFFWKVRIWAEDNRLSEYSTKQDFAVSATDKNNYITSQNFFQKDQVKPLAFEKRDKSYFVDFGKDGFANLSLEYSSAAEDTLYVHLGEELLENKINRTPGGTIRYQMVKIPVNKGRQTYSTKLAVDKRNTGPKAIALPDSFPVLMPFRYVEIENAKSIIRKEDLTQTVYYNYFDYNQSSFTSSDTVLNKIWELSKYTIKATTFTGLYVDGDRERIPYEADAYLNQLSHYTTDREYAIARRTIEYFMANPTWPTEWQQHVALMFYDDYMYTGNTELIAKYYDELKYKTLMDLDREDGLISSASEKNNADFMKKLGFKDPTEKLKDIVDWPPAQKDTGWKLATAEGERDGFVFKPINTLINAFYYRNLVIMAEFAKVLGKSNEALDFSFKAAKVKKRLNEILFDSKNGYYVDGEGTDHAALHTNMVALAFDLVPKDRQASVIKFIKSRGMACSVYGSQYLLDGLYEAGEADYSLSLLNATHDRSWYNMIRIGSTMALEAWDMKYKPNSDWNHAWGATPANIIPRQLFGIKPKTPGAEIITIRPQMSDLKFAEVSTPFLKGIVSLKYERKNKLNKLYEIEIPGNMVAEFSEKLGPNDIVMLNGSAVNTKLGNIRLDPGKHKIEIKESTF